MRLIRDTLGHRWLRLLSKVVSYVFLKIISFLCPCVLLCHESGRIHAVTYARQDRPHRTATMTPSVARQTTALLCVHGRLLSLLHPLTEEPFEQWPSNTVTQLAVNSNTHTMQLTVCDVCEPRDGGVISVTCLTGAQQPASSVITNLELQSCMKKGEKEIVCEFQHSCDSRLSGRPDSRCSSVMSKSSQSLCGSCGNLFEPTLTPSMSVGHLMKVSATKQLSSIYDASSGTGSSTGTGSSRTFEEDSVHGADPEGYMIMKNEENSNKVSRSCTLPAGASAPLSEGFRRNKSASLRTHARLSRVSGHPDVAMARSLNSSVTAPEQEVRKRASTEGEPTYMEPIEVSRRMSHLADSIPQLKPCAQRTASEQSEVSTGGNEHYASSTVLTRKTSVRTPPSGDSGSSSSDTARSSIVTDGGLADNSETDEDGYSYMSFPEPIKPSLRPSMSSRNGRSEYATGNSMAHTKSAHRTRSSPSALTRLAQRRAQPRYRTASPSFSELERRAAAASAKVQRRRDEELGYVAPEPVSFPRRHIKATSSSTSLPLTLPANRDREEASYMTLLSSKQTTCKSESVSFPPTSASPDSGLGQDALGAGEHERKSDNKATIIKKRVSVQIANRQSACVLHHATVKLIMQMIHCSEGQYSLN